MRLAIVANCQADPLTSVLRLALPRDEVVSVVVNRTRTLATQQAALDILLNCDVVATQPLGPAFGPLETSALREAVRELRVFPNLFYRGFHPDMAYAGPVLQRLQGPMGDYHSIVALNCFVAGIDAQRCIRDYDDLLEQMAPCSLVMDTSRLELIRRAQEIDLPADELVSRTTEHGLSMYTMNHPMNALVGWTASLIARSFGVGARANWSWLSRVADNPLGRSVVWPVPRRAARAHGIPADGEPVFRDAKGRVYDLASFIEESYAAYAEADTSMLVLRRPDLPVWTP